MKLIGMIAVAGALLLTANQQGQRLFDAGEYAQAAEIFEDPMRCGAAWYKAGEFKKAAAAFQTMETAEAFYNRGNCLVFLGKYEDAVKSYERALALKPNWPDAVLNMQIAAVQAKALEQTGGEMGDQKIGADEIRFDKQKPGGRNTDINEEQQHLSNQDMQALWLRRVQTDPADFLKNKFMYQQANPTADE